MNKNRISAIVLIWFFCFAWGSANDAGLASMGDVSLIFQDVWDNLDLYGFAGITSGFFRHESTSSVVFRGSWLRQSWADDSLVFLGIGQAIPVRIAGYVPIEVTTISDVLPQLEMPPCEFVYTLQRREVGYDDFGSEISPTAFGIHTGYSYWKLKLIDEVGDYVLKVPSLYLVHAKPLSDNVDYGVSGTVFYGTFRTADEQDEISLLPLGIGSGISYSSRVFDIGVNVDYYYPMFHYKHTWFDGEYDMSFSGHAFSPSYGSIVRFSDIVWASSFTYSWATLSGSSGDSDLGDVELIGFNTKTQLLLVRPFARLSGYAQYGYDKPKYTDDMEQTLFEVVSKNLVLGAGAGITAGRLHGGIEGFYVSLLADDRILDESYDANGYNIKCGGELRLINNLFLRGGYNYSQLDLALEELFVDDRITSNTYTCGLGIDVVSKARIDIAYNYAVSESETEPNESLTDHIICIYLKYSWIPRIY